MTQPTDVIVTDADRDAAKGLLGYDSGGAAEHFADYRHAATAPIQAALDAANQRIADLERRLAEAESRLKNLEGTHEQGRNSMRLTAKEIRLIFDALEAKYGRGYSKEKAIGQLQAKLSIMLEVAEKMKASKIATIAAKATL